MRFRYAAPALLSLAALGATVFSCSKGTTESKTPTAGSTEVPVPTAVQQPLAGGPFPALLLTQAWFYKGADGKPNPGPARLEIWRNTDQGWTPTRLEDPESNVFHKALAWDGGILTIGGEKAMLKKWVFKDGKWAADTLWQKSWGGKFNRLRDVEIGDVNGDGKDEIVIATHDNGVIAVYSPGSPDGTVVELDPRPDTFVHEIEIGDIDGDGKKEFFATPSGRNKADASQEGGVVMYKWDGATYKRTEVEWSATTHAKELLVTDLDNDKVDDFLVVFEAELDAAKTIVTPVQIRLYTLGKDGKFSYKVIASIDDRQDRFLTAGDLDGDGEIELVAAAMKTGVWVLDRNGGPKDGAWTTTNIDTKSSGFEHVAKITDLDGDGKAELYIAADDQRELKRYTWNATSRTFDRQVLGKLADETFTWNMEPGRF